MGGYGSGRQGGRPTVEISLTLDIGMLRRRKIVAPGRHSGTLSWTNGYTGEESASLRFETEIDAAQGRIRLTYTQVTAWDGEKTNQSYWVRLETTPQPFGGNRWWFICPSTGARCVKLHLPPGGTIFASREAYRLGYNSQRETVYDRALRRSRKLRRKLNGDVAIGSYIEKPKWTRWRTYHRLINQIKAADQIADERLINFAMRFLKWR